jgi:hypothetical protein
MAKTLADITDQLEEPFAIQDIDLLPKGQVERDGKMLCMALPYADPRVYQDRLNTVAPGEWSTPPPIALAVGQKIVVYVTVTICGISHTDVGEASATSENAATESYAQGFKRACAQFGLGRYLYSLEKAWVPYNKQRKQIDLDAAGIQRTVQQMYAKARIPLNAHQRASSRVSSEQDNASHAPQSSNAKNEAGDSTSLENIPTPTQLRSQCKALFGPGKWDKSLEKVLKHIVSDDGMTPEDCIKMQRSFDIVVQNRASKAS